MKRIMRKIDIITWFDHEGNITPIKFKIIDENAEEAVIIKVDRIIHRTKERFAGNTMIVFECQSMIDDVLKRYQIKYEIEKQRWFLYKI